LKAIKKEKVMSKLRYSFLLLVLWPLIFTGQTFEKDLEQIHLKFVNANYISYRLNYVLKESHDINSRVISTLKGRYVRNEKVTISQMDQIYSVGFNDKTVIVNKDDKQLFVKNEAPKPSQAPDALQQLKEYNQFVSKTTRLATSKKDIVMYVVELKSNVLSGVSKYEVSFNEKTFFMDQLTLYYKKPLPKDENYGVKGTEIPRLEIQFYDFDSKAIYDKAELSATYYYTKGASGYVPSFNFKGYGIKEMF
jgi:outer membrane lipoprotein-sorting protein